MSQNRIVELAYAALRVVSGLLFTQAGGMKLFHCDFLIVRT